MENWKPYWGNTSTAIPGPAEHEIIKIVHFHGPKLSTAICFMDLLNEEASSGESRTSIERISECGLGAAPNGNKIWLQLLSDILTGAHRRDGRYFYRELLREFQQYLNIAAMLRPEKGRPV